MSYFIHNKYDSNSISKVTSSSSGFTYTADSTVTVIDYYGLLEAGDTTYQYVNTQKMGIEPIDALEYSTVDEANLSGNTPVTNGNSNQSYATDVFSMMQQTNNAVGNTQDTGGSITEGTIMAKLNALIKANGGEKTYKLYPSEHSCLYFDNTSRSVRGRTDLVTVTPKYNGFLAFRCFYKPGNPNYYCQITVNNSIIGTGDTGATLTMDDWFIFSVTAGTTYTIRAVNSDYTSKYYGTISKFGIYGELVQDNKIFNEI